MAKERATVLEFQGIWDIAIQCYGSVESVFDVLADNALATGLNTTLSSGQVMRVVSTASDADVKLHYKTNDLHPVTGLFIVVDGDFNDDFNSDFFNQDEY